MGRPNSDPAVYLHSLCKRNNDKRLCACGKVATRVVHGKGFCTAHKDKAFQAVEIENRKGRA